MNTLMKFYPKQTQEDVNLNIEGDILKVSYTKDDTEKYQNREYYYSGIAKRSFNFGRRKKHTYNPLMDRFRLWKNKMD